jgi:hypothetical protein
MNPIDTGSRSDMDLPKGNDYIACIKEEVVAR